MSKLIPKYQTAWGKLTYTGPLYSEVLSLMKSENPLVYKRLLTERAKSKLPHSEVVIDDEGNTVTNVGAGYMSGTDPLGEMYVSGVALDPAFKWLGKQALWGLGKTGNKWARAKLISREMTPSKTVVPISNLDFELDLKNPTKIRRSSIPEDFPKSPEILDPNIMAPLVSKYFTKTEPYKESFHSNRDYATVIGEYNNPLTLIYYDNIVKPLLKDHNDIKIKPIKVLKFDEQPNWAGIHKRLTDENFVGLNIPEVSRVHVHESVSHGTDKYIDPYDYQSLYFDDLYNPFSYTMYTYPSNINMNIRQSALVPGIELRSTFLEARSELYEEACLESGKILNLDEFKQFLDKLDDSIIFNSMYVNSNNYLRNGYAARMSLPFLEVTNVLTGKVKPPKNLVSKYRELYKTLPIIGVPILGAFKNLE